MGIVLMEILGLVVDDGVNQSLFAASASSGAWRFDAFSGLKVEYMSSFWRPTVPFHKPQVAK